MNAGLIQGCDRVNNVDQKKMDHEFCILCGCKNPWSLKLSFNYDGKYAYTSFRPNPALAGYKGILHGGVISAILDSAMTNCLFHQGVKAVTGELNVKFVYSVPCMQALDIKAWVQSSRSPLYKLKSEISIEGKIMAWAEAKFMKIQ